MRHRGGGSIINLTSIEAHRAAPGFAVYAGMKAAVTNFGRTMAVELAADGIRVNTIAPDMVPTEGMAVMAAGHPAPDPELAAAAVRIAVPMGSRGTYEDVGGCALFLASDLSRFVTGSTLHADGGTYASSGWFDWPGTGFAVSPPLPAVRAVLDAPQP
jgi:NAD(P)-dependent dehydrogenase (short-subunit alcohol dehydrogenase family)